MAQSTVADALVELGGEPILRDSFITNNGNVILDVHGLRIADPTELEAELDHIPGIVCNGLFARRPADVLLVGSKQGVRVHEQS